MKNSKLVAISEFKPENLKLKDIRFLPSNIIEPRDLKGSKFVQNSIEEVKVNSNVFNYLTPSMIGIQLTIVENNLKKFLELKVEIAEIAKHQNLKYKKDDSLFEESLKFYDLIECAYQSIIFSFTALEAFINICIPESFIWHKTTNKNTEIYTKDQIERHVSWKEKIDILVKEIYEIEEIKREVFWSDLHELEKIRNRLIHVKSTDDTSVIESLMKIDLARICESSEKFIAYIYPKAFKKDKLHNNLAKFPYVKSLEMAYILSKEVDEITPLITYEEFLEQCKKD